jgi:anti-sigma factor RsiW
MYPAIKAALVFAAAAGFLAGKANADVKIRQAIQRQNLRLAQLNAHAMADELESRKLLIIKPDTPRA